MSRHAASPGRRGRPAAGPAGTGPAGTGPAGTGPAGRGPEPVGRRQHLAAAAVAVVLTVALAVAADLGRPGVLAGVAVVQALLIPAWVFGTGLPGRIGAILIGLGAAVAADAALLVEDRTSLTVVLGVVALAFPAMLVHQLARGVVRVRVTESLSGVAMLVAAVAAGSAVLALARAVDGDRLASAVVVAAGAGLAVARVVDAVAPAPRLAEDVAHGLLAVLAAIGVGALAGWLHAGGQLTGAGGALLGGVVGGVAALLAVGVGYIAGTVEPRPARVGPAALAYLSVALPLALTAPVGYLVALSVAG